MAVCCIAYSHMTFKALDSVSMLILQTVGRERYATGITQCAGRHQCVSMKPKIA